MNDPQGSTATDARPFVLTRFTPRSYLLKIPKEGDVDIEALVAEVRRLAATMRLSSISVVGRVSP